MIASVLATMALPATEQFIERNQQTNFTNQLVSSLYLARSEAAKRGFPVTLCASSDQQTCDVEAKNYSKGWLVFVDYDNNGRASPNQVLFDLDGNGTPESPELILLRSGSLDQRYTVEANVTSAVRRLTYLPSGQCTTRLFSLNLSHTKTQQLFSKISFAITGRIRACAPKADGTC